MKNKKQNKKNTTTIEKTFTTFKTIDNIPEKLSTSLPNDIKEEILKNLPINEYFFVKDINHYLQKKYSFDKQTANSKAWGFCYSNKTRFTHVKELDNKKYSGLFKRISI